MGGVHAPRPVALATTSIIGFLSRLIMACSLRPAVSATRPKAMSAQVEELCSSEWVDWVPGAWGKGASTVSLAYCCIHRRGRLLWRSHISRPVARSRDPLRESRAARCSQFPSKVQAPPSRCAPSQNSWNDAAHRLPQHRAVRKPDIHVSVICKCDAHAERAANTASGC